MLHNGPFEIAALQPELVDELTKEEYTEIKRLNFIKSLRKEYNQQKSSRPKKEKKG